MHDAHRSIAIATVTLLTFIAASAPATARAQLEIGYAPNPYGFAATCDLARPLLSLNLDVRNTGDIPSKPRAIVVTDDTGAFHADDTLPPIAPNASTIYRVDIRYVPGGAGIAGTHRLSPVVGNHHVSPIEIVVPSSLCHATPAPVGLPSFGTNPSLSRGGANDVTRRIATVAVPVVGPIAYGNAARNTAGRLTLAIAPPTITRNVDSLATCAAHAGLVGSLVCPDLLKTGDLILIWDWQAAAGPTQIDGYRIYRVDGGSRTLAYTRTGKELTLADIVRPAGGYGGACYAISAFSANLESALGPTYCANGGSTTKSLHLGAIEQRSSWKKHVGGGFSKTPEAGTVVGFEYSSRELLFGDNSFAIVHRAAFAFDVSPVLNHRIVSATFHATIRSSTGAGNNHSCATHVGTGTEFWWQNTGWIDAMFGAGIVPTDTGPIISADVTTLVAPWSRGEPNYGFVLRNEDENLDAFTNKVCVTEYTSPALDIVYY